MTVLELAFGAGCFGPGISAAQCRSIRGEARRLGLHIASVASGNFWGRSLSDPRAAVRRKAIAFAREYLAAARAVARKWRWLFPER